jgi:hypothetical protein
MDNSKDNPLLGFFIIGAIIFFCMYQENTNLRKDCEKLNTQIEELQEKLDDANNDAVSYEFLYCNAIHHRSKECIISLKEWQQVDPTGEVRRDIIKEAMLNKIR